MLHHLTRQVVGFCRLCQHPHHHHKKKSSALSMLALSRFISMSCLNIREDRYKSVWMDLADLPVDVPPQQFESTLQDKLVEWRSDHRPAALIYVPIEKSYLIPVAAKLGFIFHHAEGGRSLLTQWLLNGVPNKIPMFATHQVGVAGCVVREDTNQVLMVQEKTKHKFWKFPGGLNELGEDIGETARREVHEETGIETEFKGVLNFRQQHNMPGAYGRSDLFFVCYLTPLTMELNPDSYEIHKCEWMDIDEVAKIRETSPITVQTLRLVNQGLRQGFESVHLVPRECQSFFKGLAYQLFTRPLL